MGIGIEIKVIHIITEEDLDNDDLGMQLNIKDEFYETYTLFNIDYTKPINSKTCIISSAGLDFIINESYESINSRIRDRIICLLN